MPPTENTPEPDKVDTHKVEQTGDKTETTDTHHEAGKPEVNTETKTIEKTQE